MTRAPNSHLAKMAQIIPSAPLGSLPNEVLRAFRFLKSLPDDYVVWHHLTPWDLQAPDFLVVNPSKKALLIKVSTARTKSGQPAAQMLLMGDSRDVLGQEEERIINQFCDKLAPPVNGRIKKVVLFCNLRTETLASRKPNDHSDKFHWVGQDVLQSDNFNLWVELFTGESLDDYALERLRMAFAPEIVVPASLTVRPPDQGRHTAGLQDYLLDILQETVVKNDLELPPEQVKASKDFHVNIINGVAGSGKTLILLYRLRLLNSLFPDKRCLILTHNRPLIRDMQSRYKQLTGELPRIISWETFNGFCRRYWPESKDSPWVDPIGKASRERIIQSVWDKHFAKSSIPPESLESEIDWFKDQIPMDKQAYLKTERRGRGFRLNQEQRSKMWEAMAEYQNLLKDRNNMDWGDVPRRFWRFVQDGKVKLPVYEFVMIDEAQFFAPIWFDIIRRVVKPKSGSIFIVADPTQGFLGRGSSWKSIGFDARGKTQQIRRSYRTTHEILNFATLLYRNRVPKQDSDDDIIEPDLMNMPHGALPILVPVRSSQDEIGVVTAEVEALYKKGYPLHNILILHADWEGTDQLLASLNKNLGDEKAIDPKETLPGDCVRVTTLNAGTGLESQIVFLVGLNRLFEREQSLRLAEDEVEQLILENTRKVYMAATRAGQRLVITYAGNNIPQALKDLLKT